MLTLYDGDKTVGEMDHTTLGIKLSDANCWFPHVLPDGKWVADIAYGKDDVTSGDHPPKKY